MRALVLLVLISLSLVSNQARSEISDEYIDNSIVKAANKVDVPPILLRAICMAESNLVPHAYVHDDGGKANHAIGICQVLVRTAEEHGMSDQDCHDDYREPKSRRRYGVCDLFGPYTNAFYAAKYLKKQLNRYDGSWIAAIAAYNAGSLKTCSPKGYYLSYNSETGEYDRKVACIPGAPINQKYVDRVLKAISKPKLQERVEDE